MTQILWKSYILSSYVVRYVLQNLMGGGKKLKFNEMYQLFERKQPFSIKSIVFESSKKNFHDFAEVLGDFFKIRNLALL